VYEAMKRFNIGARALLPGRARAPDRAPDEVQLKIGHHPRRRPAPMASPTPNR
jgi:hypothetical protein